MLWHNDCRKELCCYLIEKMHPKNDSLNLEIQVDNFIRLHRRASMALHYSWPQIIYSRHSTGFYLMRRRWCILLSTYFSAHKTKACKQSMAELYKLWQTGFFFYPPSRRRFLNKSFRGGFTQPISHPHMHIWKTFFPQTILVNWDCGSKQVRILFMYVNILLYVMEKYASWMIFNRDIYRAY